MNNYRLNFNNVTFTKPNQMKVDGNPSVIIGFFYFIKEKRYFKSPKFKKIIPITFRFFKNRTFKGLHLLRVPISDQQKKLDIK